MNLNECTPFLLDYQTFYCICCVCTRMNQFDSNRPKYCLTNYFDFFVCEVKYGTGDSIMECRLIDRKKVNQCLHHIPNQ